MTANTNKPTNKTSHWSNHTGAFLKQMLHWLNLAAEHSWSQSIQLRSLCSLTATGVSPEHSRSQAPEENVRHDQPGFDWQSIRLTTIILAQSSHSKRRLKRNQIHLIPSIKYSIFGETVTLLAICCFLDYAASVELLEITFLGTTILS